MNLNLDEKISFFRQEISKEKIVVLDFDYISSCIEEYWEKHKNISHFERLKAGLMSIFMENLKEDHIACFSKLGLAKSYVAAVCIRNIFKTDSPNLSLLIHEVLSDLFCLTDIKYDYEEHKALYLKPSGENYKNWGNGYGEIIPHSDDLYEGLDIDFLSLTVCRDTTKTPTICFFPKDILKNFSDNEISQLFEITAEFKSGKNVDVLKARKRNIIQYSEKYGFRFFWDFRNDDITGKRMMACNPSQQELLDKLEISAGNGIEVVPETGTFLIVANHKVLHARGQLKIDKNLAKKCAKSNDLLTTPRLLFRSKGPRKEQKFYV